MSVISLRCLFFALKNREMSKHFWVCSNVLKCLSASLYTVKCLLNAKWSRMNFSRFCTSDLSKPSKSILDLSKHSRAQCYLCIHLSFHQGWLMWSLLTLVSHHHHRSASALCALVTGIMDLTYNTYNSAESRAKQMAINAPILAQVLMNKNEDLVK